MPRKPRMYLPDVPAHVVQRGNNRAPCFFTDADRRYYLDRLQRALRRYGVQLHAYVLMTNHVHLLLTPRDTDGISRLMALLGQQYVRYINRSYRRSGTLWEGRHKSSLVDTEKYLFCCYRYIEMNPVRAGLVEKPGDYSWSSYRYHARGEPDSCITEHHLYTSLAANTRDRVKYYRELFYEGLSEDELRRIRHCTHHNYPLGTDQFRCWIETLLGRGVGRDQTGRPPG